ncbi:thaumatin-like protein 1b [Lotus japonicus]|uniref:thaumatin-like protein 1b n=1 Tax=Lotus japonicus TaxID=34305 RepID=UPI0025849EE5|nr:thaumatin-like protein 1b [Lotus japonicus]
MDATRSSGPILIPSQDTQLFPPESSSSPKTSILLMSPIHGRARFGQELDAQETRPTPVFIVTLEIAPLTKSSAIIDCHTLLQLCFFLIKNVVGKPNPFVGGAYIQLINGCHKTIWPDIHTRLGHPIIPTIVKLESKDIYTFDDPDSWSGTIWGRTRCKGNSTDSSFYCDTGDCATHKIRCRYRLPSPHATPVNLNLAPNGSKCSYEVDMRYNFNLLVTIYSFDLKCKEIQCLIDMRSFCLEWLAIYDSGGLKVGCKSACYTAGDQKLCCSRAYAPPEKCELNNYTQLDDNCPYVISNAFDQTHFTCYGGASYVISFCV